MLAEGPWPVRVDIALVRTNHETGRRHFLRQCLASFVTTAANQSTSSASIASWPSTWDVEVFVTLGDIGGFDRVNVVGSQIMLTLMLTQSPWGRWPAAASSLSIGDFTVATFARDAAVRRRVPDDTTSAEHRPARRSCDTLGTVRLAARQTETPFIFLENASITGLVSSATRDV
jgi:hypothetical protein